MTDVKLIPVSELVSKIDKGEYFSFARYGDGEFNAIRKKRGQNCDGHNYFPAMGDELLSTLTQPKNYIYSIQRLMAARNSLTNSSNDGIIKIQWADADILHDANENGTLWNFIQGLRKKKLSIIGPSWLSVLKQKVFPDFEHVIIPEKNFYLTHKEVKLSQSSNRVILFSCGMPAKLLIYNWQETHGRTNWMIDCGSMWDVYCGKNSRKYHSNINNQIIKWNLNL